MKEEGSEGEEARPHIQHIQSDIENNDFDKHLDPRGQGGQETEEAVHPPFKEEKRPYSQGGNTAKRRPQHNFHMSRHPQA